MHLTTRLDTYEGNIARKFSPDWLCGLVEGSKPSPRLLAQVRQPTKLELQPLLPQYTCRISASDFHRWPLEPLGANALPVQLPREVLVAPDRRAPHEWRGPARPENRERRLGRLLRDPPERNTDSNSCDKRLVSAVQPGQ